MWHLLNFDMADECRNVYSYFEKSCRKKCTRQSRKVLWVNCSSKKFERIARDAMDIYLLVLKKSNESRLDSCCRQEQCIGHIPYYLSRLSRAHFFPTTFLEIAVYI